jgi:hypothetical protein
MLNLKIVVLFSKTSSWQWLQSVFYFWQWPLLQTNMLIFVHAGRRHGNGQRITAKLGLEATCLLAYLDLEAP